MNLLTLIESIQRFAAKWRVYLALCILLGVIFGFFFGVRAFWRSKFFEEIQIDEIEYLLSTPALYARIEKKQSLGLWGVRYLNAHFYTNKLSKVNGQFRVRPFKLITVKDITILFKPAGRRVNVSWDFRFKDGGRVILRMTTDLIDYFFEDIKNRSQGYYKSKWHLEVNSLETRYAAALLFRKQFSQKKHFLQKIRGRVSGEAFYEQNPPYDFDDLNGAGLFTFSDTKFRKIRFKSYGKAINQIAFKDFQIDLVFKKGLFKLQKPIILESNYGGLQIDGSISVDNPKKKLEKLVAKGAPAYLRAYNHYVHMQFKNSRLNLLTELASKSFRCLKRDAKKIVIRGVLTHVLCHAQS